MNRALYFILVLSLSYSCFASPEIAMTQSKYYGNINIDWDTEVSIERNLQINGRVGYSQLMIEPEVKITDSLRDQIDKLEYLDKKSREFFKKYSDDENGVVGYFIQYHLEESSSEIIKELNIKGKLTNNIFLENTSLVLLHIYPDNEGELLFALDYSISQDISNELLVVIFDSKGNIQKITHES